MAQSLVSKPQLPRHFGRYTLFDFIGQGGMAEIYLARAQTDLGGVRLSVIKQILPQFAGNAHFADMLVHEAKLSAGLSHANVVQVFDLGREEGRLYIAMEYVEGFDLNTLLRLCSKSQVALPVEFALRIGAELLKGLDYAHRRTSEGGQALGIVHCDVSPSNVLVSVDGEVKVCDFGIARANAAIASSDERAEEFVRGKAGYMSPEQARGEDVDARADVFAAGIVLWELIAGRRLYRAVDGGDSLLELARRAEHPELPVRDLPEEHMLRACIARALEPDRQARYPAGGAMLRDLEAFMAAAGFFGSPLRFGDWLRDHFGRDIVERRRSRERAVMALERAGAPVTLVAIDSPVAAERAPIERVPSAPTSHPTLRSNVLVFGTLVAIAAIAILWVLRSR
jgi:serine/threonine-protein kinase